MSLPALPLGPSVVLQDLVAGYRRRPAIQAVTHRFAAGSLTAVIGPNGAGKSTLLKAIVGTIRPWSGTVECTPALDPGGVAYLAQAALIDRSFPISVRDLVRLGHYRRAGAQRRLDGPALERVERALAATGLAKAGARAIAALSAGQFQRALFARLIVEDAALIVLDEPFTGLDSQTAAALMRFVADWHGEGRTVIAVLHDLDQVRRWFPQTLILAGSLIAAGPSEAVLCETNLSLAQARLEQGARFEARDAAAHPP